MERGSGVRSLSYTRRLRDSSPAASHRSATLGEVALNELHGQRAFPDGGSDPLDGPMPRVADDEDSGLAGLQRIWLSFEWPPRARPPVLQEIAAGQVETVFVEPQPICNPFRRRFASDENEESVRRHLFIGLGFVVAGMMFAALDEILPLPLAGDDGSAGARLRGRWDRRLRIVLDWTVALFFRPDITKIDLTAGSKG